MKRNLIAILNAMLISYSIGKENAAFFLLLEEGKLPPPKAAKTLSIEFLGIYAEKGEIEVEFEAIINYL